MHYYLECVRLSYSLSATMLVIYMAYLSNLWFFVFEFLILV